MTGCEGANQYAGVWMGRGWERSVGRVGVPVAEQRGRERLLDERGDLVGGDLRRCVHCGGTGYGRQHRGHCVTHLFALLTVTVENCDEVELLVALDVHHDEVIVLVVMLTLGSAGGRHDGRCEGSQIIGDSATKGGNTWNAATVRIVMAHKTGRIKGCRSYGVPATLPPSENAAHSTYESFCMESLLLRFAVCSAASRSSTDPRRPTDPRRLPDCDPRPSAYCESLLAYNSSALTA